MWFRAGTSRYRASREDTRFGNRAGSHVRHTSPFRRDRVWGHGSCLTPANKLGEARLCSRARRRRPRSRLLDFLLGLLLRDGPAGSILESSLCLRRSSSNGLIRPDEVPRPTHGWDEARIWPRCRPLGSLFCFIRHAKRGLMRRWRKRPPDEGRGAARAQPTPMGNTSSQPRSLIDARKQKQYRGAGKPPESRRRDTKKASNHQSLRRTRAPIATPAPPPSVQPPPPRRPGPSS